MTTMESGTVAWVNGAAVENGSTFEVLNPATGETVASAVDATSELIHAAIDAADAAFSGWSATPAAELSLIHI